MSDFAHKFLVISKSILIISIIKVSARVGRASAAETEDLSSILDLVKPNTIKIGIPNFPT